MLSGVKRYAAYVRATGSTGTQYVKQAATFFGPDRHFEEAWGVESPSDPAPTEQPRYGWYTQSNDGSAEVFVNQAAIERMNRGGYRP